MLCLNKEELLINIDLIELKHYMLYSLKTNNNSSSKNLTFVESNIQHESNNSNSNSNSNSSSNKFNNLRKQNIIVTPGVPRSRVQINYTKKLSKYNEPFKINNHKNFADKLFWMFYKIINNNLQAFK